MTDPPSEVDSSMPADTGTPDEHDDSTEANPAAPDDDFPLADPEPTGASTRTELSATDKLLSSERQTVTFAQQNTDAQVLGVVREPWAVDATGKAIPVAMTASGNSLRLDVAHRSSDVSYPLEVVMPVVSGTVGMRSYTFAAQPRLLDYNQSFAKIDSPSGDVHASSVNTSDYNGDSDGAFCLAHVRPVSACRGFKISADRAAEMVDWIFDYIGNSDGTRANAFKHAYWNASMVNGIGVDHADQVRNFATNHEHNDWRDRNRRHPRSFLNSSMDMHNNRVGRRFAVWRHNGDHHDERFFCINMLRKERRGVRRYKDNWLGPRRLTDRAVWIYRRTNYGHLYSVDHDRFQDCWNFWDY